MTDLTPAPGTPQTSHKAIVGAGIAFLTLVATGLLPLLPDPQIQLVLQIILIVVGAAGVAFGVHQTPNKPKE